MIVTMRTPETLLSGASGGVLTAERRATRLCIVSYRGWQRSGLFIAVPLLASVGLVPELLGNRSRVDVQGRPPSLLIAPSMQGAMVQPAERHRELVADLPAQSPRLRKAQMMRVCWLPAAHQTGLGRHESKVIFVPASPRLAVSQHRARVVALCRGFSHDIRLGPGFWRIFRGGAAALIRSLQALPLCLERLLDRDGAPSPRWPS